MSCPTPTMSLPTHPSRKPLPPLSPHPTRPKGPTVPYRLPPYPIDLNPYTPSVPCLHCALVSSPRCSLLNLIDHRANITPPLPLAYRNAPWHMYMYTKSDVPIPGLLARCSRCVRDGIEWCVLREMGEIDRDGELTRGVVGEGDGVGGEGPLGIPLGAGALRRRGKRDGAAAKEEGARADGGAGGAGGVMRETEVDGEDSGGKKQDGSLGPVMRRARRSVRVGDLDDFEDENVDGSTGKTSASRKLIKSRKYGKSTRFRKANPALPRRNSASPSADIADYDADSDSDSDNNTDTDNDSNPDPDASDSDAKSNVSSKTSFSKRSIKSTNSTVSPFLTPSSSPPVKHPESPPPPPSPPEQISSDYVLKEETSWIWKPNAWEEALRREKVKRRKKFNREEWMGHPLFAAVTVVEVGRWDLMDLINPEKLAKGIETGKGMGTENGMEMMTPGMKRFFDSEIPFIAYVRSPGLEGREDLLQIVRTQILDVMLSYEQTEKRKKEAMSAAEGYLPLESRLGGFLTQEDLQRQFALPSWRRKGLEFLGEGMVEMWRRKKEEKMKRERKMEERRRVEKKMKELEMEGKRAREEVRRRVDGEMTWEREEGGGAGGKKEEGEQKEEKEKEDESKDQVQPSQESDITTTTTTNTSPNPPIPSTSPIPSPSPSPIPPPDPNPIPAPDQDPYTSDPDPEEPPSTPAEYFSRRHTRLHNFWTKEAQPTDFEFAKTIRQNTFRKWRGDERTKEEYKSKWAATSENGYSSLWKREENRDGEGVTTTAKNIPRWLTRQELAEFDSPVYEEDDEEEETWRPLLADELKILIDASDDEDILRFVGDGDNDVGDDEREDKEEDMDENEDEDSYPLVDHVRESMMNTR